MYYADAFSTRSGPPNSLRLELLERLQAGVEPCWAEVAELLRTTFHAAHCVVTLHHAPGVHEILATSGLTVEWEARYEETYSGSNPFVVEAHRRRTQGMESLVAAADRLVPPAELQKMPFFHEFWAPLGINDGVGVVLFDGTRSLGHISIRRKSNGIRYGEAEEARLRSVVDILRAALIRSRELRILEARAAAFDRFNMDQRGGLIVFDERNAVLAAEGTGRTLIDNFRLELMDAIAANRNDGSGSYLTIPPRTYDHSPKPGSAHSTDANNAAPRFSIELRRSVIEGRVRLLCIVKEHSAESLEGTVTLPPSLHFTPRERDVVQYLAQGLDNLSIARSLKIGLYTTKDHIKSIFRKLGVKTRAEAVAVLARNNSRVPIQQLAS